MSIDKTTSGSQPGSAQQQTPSTTPVPAIVPATFAGMPPTAQTFYAVVNADGTLARGLEVASTTKFGPGQYEVIFTHDLTGSAYVATIGDAGNIIIPPLGFVSVVGRLGNANGVFLQTADTTGNPADLGFHLAVHS